MPDNKPFINQLGGGSGDNYIPPRHRSSASGMLPPQPLPPLHSLHSHQPPYGIYSTGIQTSGSYFTGSSQMYPTSQVRSLYHVTAFCALQGQCYKT